MWANKIYLIQNLDIFRECGVLTEIGETELQRPKHSKRGLSPSSSNSSEKENFDPNRRKRLKLGKKDVCKKN